MQEKLKYFYAIGLVLILAVLATLFFKDHRWRGRLIGDIEYQEKPSFTLKTWFDGKFQDDAQKYLEQNIGLRNYFVRSRNQVYFSVFKEATARDVVIGKNNYLFEKNYLKEFIGENAIDLLEMTEFTRKAKVVQDSLNAQGKEFLIVVAPGKASMFPEYIPEEWLKKPRTLRNHDLVVQTLQNANVSVFDASSWFINMKKTSPFPLYSETGIHWTFYGESLFLDSLATYLGTKNMNVPNITFKEIKTPNQVYFPDDDIEQGMNLMIDIPNKQLGYPDINFSTIKKTARPLLIGDSYLWNMFITKKYHSLFNTFSYYFYNEDRYSWENGNTTKVTPTLLKKDLNQSNCLILLATEANLHRLYFNSIEDLYEIVTNNSEKK